LIFGYKIIRFVTKLLFVVLILASASKSRKNILKNSGIDFIQISSSFDEGSVQETNVSKLALKLSCSKAYAVLTKVSNDYDSHGFLDNAVEIIGCDSIFEFNGELFGKPTSKKDAFDRWQRMSGGLGNLYTGHTLLFCESKKDSKNFIIKTIVKKVVVSKIYFAKLTDLEIENYVNSLEPLQCAGGFALEGRGGKFIEKIDGCFSNAMGLSLPWLRKELLKKDIYA